MVKMLHSMYCHGQTADMQQGHQVSDEKVMYVSWQVSLPEIQHKVMTSTA